MSRRFLLRGLFAIASVLTILPAFARGADAPEATAMVVSTRSPLIHTAQFLPIDANGRVIGAGQPRAQIEAVLNQLEQSLKSQGRSLKDAVKVNVYAADATTIDALRAALAVRRGGANPVMTHVVGKLPHPDAMIALDAIVPGVPKKDATAVSLHNDAAIAGVPTGAQAATLPAGRHVYVSGQAAPAGKDMAVATQKTLETLKGTLDHLGLKLNDVVQVKSFLGPMSKLKEAEQEIVKFFGERTVPPLVFVEWISPSLPIEIELVVAGGPASKEPVEPVEFITPPGMSPSPVFCRVTRVNGPEIIYVAGLYGESSNDGAAEVQEIFRSLETSLGENASDLRHMVKATYYVATDEATNKLGEIRGKIYDRNRPPAASKAMVAGTGKPGKTITVDMIAVPKPK